MGVLIGSTTFRRCSTAFLYGLNDSFRQQENEQWRCQGWTWLFDEDMFSLLDLIYETEGAISQCIQFLNTCQGVDNGIRKGMNP